MEDSGSLPTLDTLITKRADGKLDITVYRKQMHKHRYLYSRSHQQTCEEGYNKVSL